MALTQGNSHGYSGIDLLVVHGGAKRDDVYGLIWDSIRLPRLQLHLYTETEYEELKRSDSAPPREAAKGITLFENR